MNFYDDYYRITLYRECRCLCMSRNLIFFLYVQNIDKIPLVKCPVLVIHVSTRDLLFCFFFYVVASEVIVTTILSFFPPTCDMTFYFYFYKSRKMGAFSCWR